MGIQLKSPFNVKRALIAFVASAIFLHVLLIKSIYHFTGEFYWEDFWIGSSQILVVSFVTALVVKFTKISKWYSLSVFGAIFGLALAVIFVQVTIRI